MYRTCLLLALCMLICTATCTCMKCRHVNLQISGIRSFVTQSWDLGPPIIARFGKLVFSENHSISLILMYWNSLVQKETALNIQIWLSVRGHIFSFGKMTVTCCWYLVDWTVLGDDMECMMWRSVSFLQQPRPQMIMVVVCMRASI